VEDGLTALSNTNVVEESKTPNGTRVFRYATTPLMSPYLVAFAVGELEYIQVYFCRLAI
jgi:aminopeptidase N